MEPQKMPIGYWIKKIDNLLTNSIDSIQSEYGLTRIGWQVLNSINKKEEIHKSELLDLMRPLAEKLHIETILQSFSADNVIETAEDKALSLTNKGKVLFANCFKRQNEFRMKVMNNISEEEYKIVVLTLQKMINNIEAE